MLASIAGFAVASIVLGAVPHVVVSFAAFVLTGFVSMAWTVTVNSYRQRVVPSALLGRVTAVYRMMAFISMPLGALGVGFASHAIGLQGSYVAGGVLLLITAALAIRPLAGMPGRPKPAVLPAD